jgi:hypothetical protein
MRKRMEPASRLRISTLVFAVISIAVIGALVPLARRGFMCGFGSSTSFRESGGEGQFGQSYWLGSVPGRFMFVYEKDDSMYPNDLPPGTPRTSLEHSRKFCHELTPAVGIADWADPTTYPTMGGIAYMHSLIEPSSHSRQHYNALIVSHWLVAFLAAAPTLFLTTRLIFGGRHDPGRCAVCGYDLRATPERCPECGTGEGARE